MGLVLEGHAVEGHRVGRQGRQEGGVGALSVRAQVELGGDHDVLAIDLVEVGRVDDDGAEHAVGDVHAHGRGGAMVDKQTGKERLELEVGLMAGSRESRDRPAARPRHGMQIDVVGHLG